MKIIKSSRLGAVTAAIAGVFIATPVFAQSASGVTTPSGVSESAPARTGPGKSPTTQGVPGGAAAIPGANTPSSVSESAPSRAGPGTSPTGGPGQSAPYGAAPDMQRLPQTPSSVSESAPARTGKATVPTARAPGFTFETADVNKDGVIDRREYERMYPARGATR